MADKRDINDRVLCKFRCTAVYGTPTMFVDLLNVVDPDVHDVSSLSMAIMAGAPCPEELARAITQRLNIKYLNVISFFHKTWNIAN